MPTYDYECGNCGHTFDAFQSMSDEPLKKCPACGKNQLKRLIGGGLGVIFKGSGFYSTDARSKSSSSSSTKSTETPATGGGEAKPAAAESGKSDGSKDSGKSSSGKTEKVAG